MLLRRIAVENVRSFLERQEILLDGPISILIGPNGGGKTNLLDIAVIILRRYLLASMYPVASPTADQPDRFEFRHNDALNNLTLQRHSSSTRHQPQIVEIELEATQRDYENMVAMKNEAKGLVEKAQKKYVNLQIERASGWNLDGITSGARFKYSWNNGSLATATGAQAEFLQYMNNFEVDNLLRAEFEISELATPMVYLPVNRSANAFQSRIELAGYNHFEQKRHTDATISRTGPSIVPLAVGRMAQKYRMLLEKDTGKARADFKNDPNLRELTRILAELGYEWELESSDPLKNAYDIRLKKQGSSFFVGAASSGERELLTYLFAIFALNVRDALIVVDEPELHLHPKWQKILLHLFVKLSSSTGNQFLLATHSPTFVSPDSIRYISRVFSDKQRSHIIPLTTNDLPDAKHLLNIVNSQNNEALFFADEVVLVEGLSDRIFFEAVFDRLGRGATNRPTIEIISVGGKGLFKAYKKLLDALRVRYSIIGDLDYVEEIGTDDIRRLFEVDSSEIKRDVIDNVKSLDGKTLVDRIDEAIARGSWDDARDVWAYIKSRRTQLRRNLTGEERNGLNEFITSKRQEKIFVLKRGALEAYLPEGFKDKDIDKLIGLVSAGDFWSRLLRDAQNEVEEIVNLIMPPQQGGTAENASAG